VQITLRELPHSPGAKKIPIEMAVIDTGKGISKEFLKEHLFHPFSQENPLQTGTGLGLAIVNSIVRSDSVNGKVDVWSSEGMGTEIRVSFEVEVIDDDDDSMSSSSSVVSQSSTPGRGHSVSLLGFNTEHRGHMLQLEVLSMYAATWQFELDSDGNGDVLIVNDDEDILDEVHSSGRPIIFLTSGRHSRAATIREAIARAGGSCQIMYKPIGPSGFRGALGTAVRYLEDREHLEDRQAPPELSTPTGEDRPTMSRGSSGASQESNSTVSELSHKKFEKADPRAPLMRRRSEENEAQQAAKRPSMAPRGITYHHAPLRAVLPTYIPGSEEKTPSSSGSPQPGSPTSSTISTISLADGGVMLKSAAVPYEGVRRERSPRVLVVEDNVINRRVLGAFLKKRVSVNVLYCVQIGADCKGMEFQEAVDGKAGVEVFESSPPNYWE
jgi:CheY-like chemotaxis protein